MRKTITASLLFFVLNTTFGQPYRNFALYLEGQYTKTIKDRTIYNNPGGIGLGLQSFFNNKGKWKPVVDITIDAYLESYKVGYLNSDGTIADDVGGIINTFIGESFHPLKDVYVSFVAGSSFVNKRALFGLKPSVGFYFPGNQRWMGKFSYIRVFHRDKTTKEDFISGSVSIAIRLY